MVRILPPLRHAFIPFLTCIIFYNFPIKSLTSVEQSLTVTNAVELFRKAREKRQQKLINSRCYEYFATNGDWRFILAPVE